MSYQNPKRMNRRHAMQMGGALSLAVISSPQFVFASEKKKTNYRIGICDWTARKQLSAESFQFAKQIGLSGVQYSFDAAGKGLDLRDAKNRATIRETVKNTGVAISSLGIGLLNKVPLSSTDEGEKLVLDCIHTMKLMKKEASELDDLELAKKVSPNIVLLAFFNKGDINGKPELIESVIQKLKRIAPLAEKYGITLAIESLLDEKTLRHIMDRVGSPAVKVYYDTANSAKMGYDIYSEIKSLGTENISEIHLKENNALIGDGKIDFVKVKSLLDQINYKGWLIIEGSRPKKMSIPKTYEKNSAYVRKLFNS